MRLHDVATTSAAVAETSARSAKIALLAERLRTATPEEVAVAVHYLSGELPQRQIGVGWATLRELPAPADDSGGSNSSDGSDGSASTAGLEVAEVDRILEEIGKTTGAGSQARRRDLLTALFARATAEEQAFLRRLLTGELRQGALDGVMADAVAKAADVPAAEVRRAAMFGGDLAAAAQTALRAGVPGLREVGLVVGRPIQPMLAGTAEDVPTALAKASPAALEWKLDGIRVQIHRDGDRVQVFTRSLDDITERLPEAVALARSLQVTSAVLDGEALALAADGRPRPFQETASRTGSRRDVERMREQIPLTVFLFDLLHLDGRDLVDLPSRERSDLLASIAPPAAVAPRLVTDDADAAEAFAKDALDRGHEGVVVKSLDALYSAGRRGSGWLKVKPVHTLDLVVLAAEWGHGRRRGWLSNLHLAARDPETGGFVMLGKTFKGMTDELLTWQTERLRALQTSADDFAVHVRPELVVEVAFDGVQRSSRYPGGVTLRFARVVRYREDKRAEDADTIDAVRAIGQGQEQA
ncbi:DNA ligase I, ATP-dependent Dnl1 [Catenulispora acidiphila DSM 44928]|uniref:Probable DNA ligase n=1 Tax=Catenulispora acidiphila (strain DSM 44928 / JCM 14897 / NBRC 102108 / NRRL B-24433 / ID139908) TaxID=479433 RepID=C7Q8T3_CATAD|nr:ATP-dependent DNA ligase [Catenulispora acidiphila]ACU70348.1 DNA ligase I, ATP-dependent Dnl1 [Catenulispora acidiphila DSM 44928]